MADTECCCRSSSGSQGLIDPNLLICESSEQYYAKRFDYLTATDMKTFLGYPEGITDTISAEDRNEKLLIGRATHTLVLEGRETFERKFTSSGNNESSDQLTSCQRKTVERLYTAVQSNPEARSLLETGVGEAVVRATYCDWPCQIRIDWFNPLQGLVDLKTTDSLDQFQRDIVAYRYHEQLAFFRSVLGAASGVIVPVYFIIASKKEMISQVREIPPETLDLFESQNRDTLKRMNSVCPQSAQT